MTLKHQHTNLDETVIGDKTMIIPPPQKKPKKDKKKDKEPVPVIVPTPFVDESVDHLDLPSSSEDHSVSIPKSTKHEKMKEKEQQRLNMIAVQPKKEKKEHKKKAPIVPLIVPLSTRSNKRAMDISNTNSPVSQGSPNSPKQILISPKRQKQKSPPLVVVQPPEQPKKEKKPESLPITTPIKNKKKFDAYEREFQIRDEEDEKDKTMIVQYSETSSRKSKGDSNNTESPQEQDLSEKPVEVIPI